MKKAALVFIVCIMVLFIIPIESIYALEVLETDFTYSILNTTDISITGYTGDDTELVLPN